MLNDKTEMLELLRNFFMLNDKNSTLFNSKKIMR